MRDVIIGWLGVVVLVVAVVASVGADVFRQRDTAEDAEGAVTTARQPGGRVFWLTVVAIVLTVAAAAFTVVRLTTLA